MRGPAALLIPFAMLTGCFYPAYYPEAPRHGYIPGPYASTPVYLEPTEPVVTAEPETAPPPAPAAPTIGQVVPVAYDSTMRRLQRERDAAQKALDDYAAECYRRSLAREARARRVDAAVAPSMPASTSLGVALGVRALDAPIDDSSTMATFGLGLTHCFAGSCAALDLGLGYAGFVETGETVDRRFSTFEATAGLRLMLSSIASGRPNDRASLYVGGGVMAVEVDDSFDDLEGETVSESDSATGSYACIGVRFGGTGTGCGDFEIRQVMDTSYSTYGQERSSDGVELLLRFAATF
jgi:hypothetical protein